ncbi:hypothetical protein C8R46DRAFT_1025820 [Mycena filopes]|nr:hypothetical protein C8R46DRAFT_1025820 [Mycena filopes]
MPVFVCPPPASLMLLLTPLSQSKPCGILTLPLEVSTEIWMYLKQSPRSLGRVVQVCKAWRQGLDVPGLWDTLKISDTTDTAVIEDWLARSKERVLTVDLDFRSATARQWDSPPLDGDWGHRQECKALIEIMDILILASPRWRSFEARGPHYLGPLLKTYLTSSTSFPHLSCLWLLFDASDDALLPVQASDSVLHAQPTTVVDVGLGYYAIEWGTLSFAFLTSLILGPFFPLNPLPWDDFADALGVTTTLSSLAFYAAIPSIIHAPTVLPRRLVLPTVTTLSLSILSAGEVQHILLYLAVPALNSLALRLPHQEGGFAFLLREIPAAFPRAQGSSDRGYVDAAGYHTHSIPPSSISPNGAPGAQTQLQPL